jgi:hypothetical protein
MLISKYIIPAGDLHARYGGLQKSFSLRTDQNTAKICQDPSSSVK